MRDPERKSDRCAAAVRAMARVLETLAGFDAETHRLTAGVASADLDALRTHMLAST